MVKTLTCQQCGVETARRGPVQKYCEPCSERRDLQRKSLWAKAHPRPRVANIRSRVALLKRRAENGVRLARRSRASIAKPSVEPDLYWLSRVAVPFSYAASKNAIYRSIKKGHVELRVIAKEWKAMLVERLRHAAIEQPIVQNKLWIDIFVEKPDHRGDAINVVDAVCDALKIATGLDDRWFCIRRLDWSIVKSNPRVIVGFGQDTSTEAQACSSCGRLLALAAFHSNASGRKGVARNCRECDRIETRPAARPVTLTW